MSGYVELPASQYFTFAYNQDWDNASLTSSALAIGAALKQTADTDFTTIYSWFGSHLTLELPFNVRIELVPTGTGHDAYANNDAIQNITLYLGTQIYTPTYIDLAREVLTAEFPEIFMVAQKADWNPGFSHGEALSRFAAFNRYPDVAPLWGGPDIWIAGPWNNWIDKTEPTDRNPDSHGCGLLFLYWVHTMLGYSPTAITQAAAPTLAAVYQKLTGNTDAWSSFTAVLNERFKPNTLNQIVGSTNPFPFPPVFKVDPTPIPPSKPLTCGQLQIEIETLTLKADKTIQEVELLQTYKDWYADQCGGTPDPGKVVYPKVAPRLFNQKLGSS